MKRLLLLSIVLISSVGFAQQSSRLPDNKELVSRARSYYVETDTFYMKREALESSLLGQAEFKAWNLQITGKQELADMVVRVKRVPFSNHFSYTVTDRETDTIVMAGKVDSLSGYRVRTHCERDRGKDGGAARQSSSAAQRRAAGRQPNEDNLLYNSDEFDRVLEAMHR